MGRYGSSIPKRDLIMTPVRRAAAEYLNGKRVRWNPGDFQYFDKDEVENGIAFARGIASNWRKDGEAWDGRITEEEWPTFEEWREQEHAGTITEVEVDYDSATVRIALEEPVFGTDVYYEVAAPYELDRFQILS